MTDVAILPSADNHIELIPSSSGANWTHVLAWPDYVRGSADNVYKTDIYSPLVTILAGTVTNVRLHYSLRADEVGHYARCTIELDGTQYGGTEHNVPGDGVWREYYHDFPTNPATGLPWQAWPDIALINFGIQLGHTSMCATVIYIVVTYAPSLGTTMYANYLGNVFAQWVLNNYQTLEVHGYLGRAAGHTKPLAIGTSGRVVGDGIMDGNYIQYADPVIFLAGESRVTGVSDTSRLTIRNSLYHGVQINYPYYCLVQDVDFLDCRSGTSTVPTTGDSVLGMGLWLNGAGTGNVLRRLNVKRCGIHGVQVCGSDNNLLDNINVDGVYGYFGLSLYQTDNTIAQNISTANTRREGVNLMQCVGSSLTDFAVRNGQTDYGVSDYLCDGSTIQRGTIDRTHKDGLAIVGSDNGQYDHIVITKACQGRYIGHYAGIMLEGSDSVGCENNIVEWCTIEDLDHRQIFNIKEVAYIPSGTNLTNSNIIRNNRCYGAIRGPVRTVGSLSTQSNNGVIEIV